MKKVFLILMILLPTAVFALNTQHKLIVSYWSDGPLYTNYPINNNENLSQKINNINVLAYAFLQVNNKGDIYFQYPAIDLSKNDIITFCKHYKSFCQNVNSTKLLGNFDGFSKLENKSHDLMKIISIGGAMGNATLNNALNHPHQFVQSAKAIIQYYHLNGIDLDFEPSGLFSKKQSDQYVYLVNLLRQQLRKSNYISIELPGDNETINSIGRKNLDNLSNNAYISLMGYEFHSAFYPPDITGNNSNLYSDANEPNINDFYHISDDQAVKHLTYLGVPSNKIILGFPAYFHAYADVSSKQNGLYQAFNPTMTPTFNGRKSVGFDSTLTNILIKGYQKHDILMNGRVSAVYACNPKNHIWISYENTKSLRAKSEYVNNENLAGMMMWNIEEDYPVNSKESLLNTVYHCMEN